MNLKTVFNNLKIKDLNKVKFFIAYETTVKSIRIGSEYVIKGWAIEDYYYQGYDALLEKVRKDAFDAASVIGNLRPVTVVFTAMTPLPQE